MNIFSVGSKYPFPILGQGARANFLHSSNLLLVSLYDIDEKERLAFKKNQINCGLIIDQPVILFLFDFKGVGELDSPFDATLYKKEELQFYDITNKEQRLLIDIHVVDLKTQILKVLRAVTMPPELTVNFLSAVQDQITMSFNRQMYEKKLSEIYREDIGNLIKKTKMYNLGE